jgi:hypothetical protein
MPSGHFWEAAPEAVCMHIYGSRAPSGHFWEAPPEAVCMHIYGGRASSGHLWEVPPRSSLYAYLRWARLLGTPRDTSGKSPQKQLICICTVGLPPRDTCPEGVHYALGTPLQKQFVCIFTVSEHPRDTSGKLPRSRLYAYLQWASLLETSLGSPPEADCMHMYG